jgi:hypothetical protein
MGLFSKERHGRTQTLVEGRDFLWEIERFDSYRPGSHLDSDYFKSFRNKEKFHFHLTIGVKGDIGFYVHYKNPPVPKYSYWAQNKLGERLRQQTAHTIPQGVERCGHWNFCVMADMRAFLEKGESSTLSIYFKFDDDEVTRHGIEDVRITWSIPRFFRQNLDPYTSKGFTHNGVLYALRVDRKASTNEFVVFAFSRRGTVPPHGLAASTADGATFAQVERNDEATMQAMMIPEEDVAKAIGRDGKLVITLLFFRNANPLEFLNTQGAGGGSNNPSGDVHAPPRTVEVGNEKYAVVNDDDI